MRTAIAIAMEVNGRTVRIAVIKKSRYTSRTDLRARLPGGPAARTTRPQSLKLRLTDTLAQEG